MFKIEEKEIKTMKSNKRNKDMLYIEKQNINLMDYFSE